MVALVVLGAVLVVAAGVLGWFGRRARARAAAITGTPTTRCADVGQATGPDGRVECVGRARPGPGGALTAPLSGGECVWYRATVTEHYWDTEHRRDAGGRTTTQRVRRQREVSDDRSAQPFLLADDSGTVAVDPRRARIDQPLQVVDEFRDRPREGFLKELVLGDRTIGYDHEEWVLPVDAGLYVNGGAVQRGDGWALAVPAGGGELLVSTRSQEELLAATERAVRWWFAGAGLAAAAGAVLLVAGLAA